MSIVIVKYVIVFLSLITVSVIGSVTAYKIAKLKHDNQVEHENRTRKRRILEEISDRAGIYSEIGIRYLTYIFEIHKSEKPLDRVMDTIEKLQNELFEASSRMKQVDSMLVLLGFNLVRRKLLSFMKGIVLITREFYDAPEPENVFKLEDLEKQIKDIKQKRDSFFVEMNKAYKSIEKTETRK